MLKGNAKVVNGTGGLLVVDVDPKNGGSVEALRGRFPDLPDTRAVQTVTPHPDGFGTHLIFTIPNDVRITHRGLGAGIDIPHSVMLPGSVIRCEDGVNRTYALVNDVEPAAAPLGLIAAIDKGQDSGIAPEPASSDDDDAVVQSLVDKFADAGPGERNAVFLQVAPAVIRLKGAIGAQMLENAYLGDDVSWIKSALRGALQKYSGADAPNPIARSRYLVDVLQQLSSSARYGLWNGKTGTTDRKVQLAVVRLCEATGLMSATASLRTLALLTGLEPKTIGSAVRRLTVSGRLCVVGTDDEGAAEYAPILGESTTVISKGESPIRGFSVDPLGDVWLSDGLTGRHSHVFDLVDGGVCRAKQIATAGGMGVDTARDALKALVEAEMLVKQGTVYSVPADVDQVAEKLAAERGGKEKRAKLTARIDAERARPRGDATPAPDDVDANDIDEEWRRWQDEELMRQLGII
ncbi:hypothetical protein BST15_11910 [Mycolicibacter arupensis]|nr:hypothetical protein BST15_11910 [Mycolicibacter arupensis]